MTETAYIETNYERTVSEHVRRHVEELMKGWRSEGREDERIEHIVRSAVLMAYAQGRFAGLQETLRKAAEEETDG